MLPVTQIDTFYNGLTLRHRDTINAAVGGNFMKRHPEECYDLIENMTAHHNDWDTFAQRNESSSSITSSNPEIASLKLQMEEMNRNLTRVLQTNQQVNTVTPSCETCGGPHSYNDCPATVGQNQNVYVVGAYNQGGNSYQPQGNRNLLSYRSDNYLGPPGFNVNQNQNRSNQNQNNQVWDLSLATPLLTQKVNLKALPSKWLLVLDEPPFLSLPFINSREELSRVEETSIDPNMVILTLKVPPPLVQKAKQRNFMIHQRDPLFKQLHINITLADALILIPKYEKMRKSLLSNKEKLIELANTPVSENCLAVILKKLPEKLGMDIKEMDKNKEKADKTKHENGMSARKRETNIPEKDEKSSKNDKTGHEVEKRGKAKVKSKPKSTKVKVKVNPEKVNGQN
ncbi:hypothetical protein Tco_1200654 [Tanacetum coccineum]